MIRRPPRSTLFPTRRSSDLDTHPNVTMDDGADLVSVLHSKRTDLLGDVRSEEHTSELQSLAYLVCRLLLEKKKKNSRSSSIVIYRVYAHYRAPQMRRR